jgi:anaerobic magnesium-protoporphyrin IX monomethyl ester cyclase
MSRILFSHAYFLKLDPKQAELAQPYPPLATITAAALLRREHHEVSLFDTQFVDKPEEVIPAIENFLPDYFVLYDDGFNYLSKMCLSNMRDAAFRMLKLITEKHIPIIVSSSDASDNPEKYLSAGADFILTGEAEQTLLELIQVLSKKQDDFSLIPGLIYFRQGKLIHTSSRSVMRDLDAMPLPAWDLVQIDKYRGMWMEHHGYFSMNIATTRGCPFKCNWCAKPIYGNRYNSRSPEHVVSELKLLKQQYAFDHIWFCDDIFGLKPGWVQRFQELVQEAGLHFRYKIQSRADLLVQENYIEALALSGCDNVWMGAESGSQKVLDAMDKGTTIEQIHTSTHLLRKHGIKPAFFIQFGYPGESQDDIQATIHMLNELLPEDIGISISYPLPGTKFYDSVKAELKEKTNWTDSDELALLFKNTYSGEFYKQLHRYVHTNYRKHQGYQSLRNLFARPGSVNRIQLRRAASVIYYIPTVLLEKRRLKSRESVKSV